MYLFDLCHIFSQVTYVVSYLSSARNVMNHLVHPWDVSWIKPNSKLRWYIAFKSLYGSAECLVSNDAMFIDLTHVLLNLFLNAYKYTTISQQWYGTGCWNIPTRKTRTHLYYTVNTTAAANLAVQGARTSTALVMF